MSMSFAPLFGIAWKLGLALATFKCGFYIAGQMRHITILSHVRTAVPPKLDPHVLIRENNAQLQAEAEDAKRTIKGLLDENERAQLEAEWLRSEAEFWRHMEDLARREIQARDAASQHEQIKISVHCDELRSLEARLLNLASFAEERERLHMQERADQEALFQRQEAELLVARRYLGSPANTVSYSEVVQMLRNLNLEISRTATFLTESFHAEEDRPVGPEVVQAFERTKDAVGPIMAELLESTEHQEDPILVQVALQADIASFAAGIISAWDFQHQSNSIFAGIHKQMLKLETQSIAGRWRALTRQYSKQRLYNGRDLTPGFTHQLAERVSDIIVIAGACTNGELILQLAAQNFETIVRLALDIQRIIGEDITDCDLEVSLARVDEVFDPDNMEDVYGEEVGGEEHDLPHVLCTSHLGLRRYVKAEEGTGDDLCSATLLRPKVVLETFVYDLGLVEEDDLVED